MGVILRYSQFLKTYKTRGYRLNHLKSYKKLFPIKSNPKLAGIVADLIGDGNLQGNPKWRLDFTSNDIKELKRFEKEMKGSFNVLGKIRQCSSNKYKTYNFAINSSPISRILFLCGVPSGQKVLQSFKVPKWVLNDKECFRRFCQRLFTCEGNLNNDSLRVVPQIRIELWKEEKLIKDGENFFLDMKKYLNKYFDIDSVVRVQKRKNFRKDGLCTSPIRMYIFGDSVIKFFKEIGFEGKKQKDLKAILGIKLHPEE